MLITTSRKSPLWMKFDWELVKATFPAHSPADTFSAPPYCTINSPPPPRRMAAPYRPSQSGQVWPFSRNLALLPPPRSRQNSALPFQNFQFRSFSDSPQLQPPHRLHQDRFQFGRNFRNSMIEIKLKCGQVTYVRIRFGIGSVDQADA